MSSHLTVEDSTCHGGGLQDGQEAMSGASENLDDGFLPAVEYILYLLAAEAGKFKRNFFLPDVSKE